MRFDLARVSTTDLLRQRICDLPLQLEDAGFDLLAQRLHKDLLRRGLRHLKPRVYIGDEWFTPEGTTLISVPFYLCNEKLTHLQKSIFGAVESRSKEWLMKLLRHEAGHCFDHAYGLSRTRAWQKVFGSPRRAYNVDSYAFDPDSKDFVINLGEHYAQSHPEEDFAETFAVWLNPRSNWRHRYRSWPEAYRKLKFINFLAERYGSEPIKIKGFQRPLSEARYLRRTLKTYFYQKQRAH